MEYIQDKINNKIEYSVIITNMTYRHIEYSSFGGRYWNAGGCRNTHKLEETAA